MSGGAELISRVREHYLQQFVAFVGVQRNQWPAGHAEVKFELSEQSDLFRRLYCTDFAANEDNNLVVREMHPDRILTFEPVSIEVRGAHVVIEQLVWDDVQLHHDAAALGGEQLDRWFDHWFDPNDARLDPASDIGGIIHSLLIKPGEVSIDLGSSAAEAFWDMLELMADAGAANIRVTSERETAVS